MNGPHTMTTSEKRPPTQAGAKPKPQKNDKKERLAKALRQNLLRRKAADNSDKA